MVSAVHLVSCNTVDYEAIQIHKSLCKWDDLEHVAEESRELELLMKWMPCNFLEIWDYFKIRASFQL